MIDFPDYPYHFYDEYSVSYVEGLKATADRRKDLLRRCQELLELSEKYIPGDLFYRDNLHDELVKELEN